MKRMVELTFSMAQFLISMTCFMATMKKLNKYHLFNIFCVNFVVKVLRQC